MKTCNVICLISFSFLLLCIFQLAHAALTYEAPQPVPGTKMKIDANLEEWKYVKDVVVIDKKGQIENAGKVANWDGPNDTSSQTWVMWDQDFIYIAAEAKDEKLQAKQEGGSIWKNEGLEIFFSAGVIKEAEGGWPHDNVHYQFGLTPSGPNKKPQQWIWCSQDLGKGSRATDYIEIASKLRTPYTGYVIEASMKLDGVPKLAKEVGEGKEVSFSVTLNDADDSAENETQMTWHGKPSHSQLDFGILTFGGPLAVSPRGKMITTWSSLKSKYLFTD